MSHERQEIKVAASAATGNVAALKGETAMKRLLIAALMVLPAVGCDRADAPGAAREGPGAATDLVEQMAARGRLPQRDYVCRLTGGERSAPYGVLGVAADRYTLVAKGGGREEGAMTLDADRTVTWDGDLGQIDDDRRVSSARLNSEGDTLELSFGFSPALDGHDRLVCTAEA